MDIVTQRGDVNLTNLESMELALQTNKHIQSKLDDKAKEYHTVDVSATMKELAAVGSSLHFAYAGSRGFKCSANIMEIMTKYQDMIKNTFDMTKSFPQNCLEALEYHNMALEFAKEDNMDSAIDCLSECANSAKHLADQSGKLINEATALIDLSGKALIEVQKDETLTIEQKAEITENIQKGEKRRADLNAETELLYEQINEYKIYQANAAKKADDQRQREHTLLLISAVANPVRSIVSDVAGAVSAPVKAASKGLVQAASKIINPFNWFSSSKNKVETNDDKTDSVDVSEASDTFEAEKVSKLNIENNTFLLADKAATLDEKEMQFMKKTFELQKEEREMKGELASIGEELKGLKLTDNTLAASLKSLELCIKAMGKVTTTFQHTRQFWLSVERQCRDLANTNKMKHAAINKLIFIPQLKKSALGWLTLGKISCTAVKTIQEVDQKYDKLMCNLPTKDEAFAIIRNELVIWE